MGLEATTEATFRGKTATGKARLETDTLEFRSNAFKLSILFKEVRKVLSRDGTLTMTTAQGTLSLSLGPAAVKWATKIQHPPSRLEKIGVKPDWKASAIGIADEEFLDDLERAVRVLSVGRVSKDCDAVFYGVTRESDLGRLPALKRAIVPTGAIWVVRPKGRPEISERAVMAAGKAAGLVDVKVVGFSPTHTAEKFVIPVEDRRSSHP